MITFEKLESSKIKEMSDMAKAIVKEHFDPIIGAKQNDYMISLFQTEEAISNQLSHGYNYYFVKENEENIGFLAYIFKRDKVYLSKFYLYKNKRGKGYAKKMLEEVEKATRNNGFTAIELNVNHDNDACRVYEALGLIKDHEECNEIGNGFFMNDYVYRKELQ